MFHVVKLLVQGKVFEGDLVPAFVFLTVQVQGQMILHDNLLIVLHTLSEQHSLLVPLVHVALPKKVNFSCLMWYCSQLIR